MKVKLCVLLGVLAAVIVAAVVDRQHGVSHPQEDVRHTEGLKAADVEVALLMEDGKLRLSDLKGKYVLLNFWASWCAPCIAEFPLLVRLASDEQKNLIVLAVSVDDVMEDARGFVRKLDTQNAKGLRFAWDVGKHVSRDVFQSFRYPESILIDPQGIMIRKFSGALNEASLQEIRTRVQ